MKKYKIKAVKIIYYETEVEAESKEDVYKIAIEKNDFKIYNESEISILENTIRKIK